MISYFLKKRVYDTVTHRGGTLEGTSNYLIFLVHFLNTGKGRGHDREKKAIALSTWNQKHTLFELFCITEH